MLSEWQPNDTLSASLPRPEPPDTRLRYRHRLESGLETKGKDDENYKAQAANRSRFGRDRAVDLDCSRGEGRMRGRARNGGTFAPELRGLQDPAAMGQEDLSEQAGSPQAQDQDQDKEGKGSDATILGFWKVIAFSGGVLNDVGFQQFNAGGTELVNDVGALDAGTNFCLGAWKRVRGRTYELVHTFIIFDSSGKKAIAIAIEESRLIVARDGNTFRGTWTQDNYDLSGNLLPGTHFEGTIIGTRIAPGLPFPFPL